MTEKLKELIEATATATAQLYAVKNDKHFMLPVTYSFFCKNDDGNCVFLDSLDEDNLYEKIQEVVPPEKLAEAEDLGVMGETVHSVALKLVRQRLRENEDIEWLTITAEAWLTPIDTETQHKKKPYEVINYTAHDRAGNTLTATQSIIRPAGRAPSLDDDLEIQPSDLQQTGEILLMFPSQRTDAKFAEYKHMREFAERFK